MINTTWMTREVEYLESTGNQWIDTEVYLRTPLRIEWEYYYPNRSTGASIWGAYRQSGISCYAGNSNSSTTREVLVAYNGTMIKIVNGRVTPFFPYRSIATFEAKEGSQTFTTEFGGASASAASGLGDTLTAKCYLFAQGRPNDATPYSIAISGTRIYSWKCWVGGKLVFDGVPYRVGQTGYMYDRVSRRLFGNKGTGSFVLGPDVAKPVMGLWGMRKFYNARDYVQDGLIAQWDVDGGQLLSDTSFVTCVNYVQTLWTCEILVLPSTLTSCVVKWASNNYPTLYTSNGYPVNAVYTGSKYYSGYNRAPNPAGAVWSDTNVSFGNGTGHYYKNGVKVGEYTVPGNMTQNSHVVNISTNPAKLINYLASVRTYNRALSPAEIAHNYAIDKARFNLP